MSKRKSPAQPATPIDYGCGDPLVLSLGLGVDSVAVLVGWCKLGIRPDVIIFSDPGSEMPETYAFMPVLSAWLEKIGFPPITVVKYVLKRPRNGHYSTIEENCLVNKTLPSIAFGRKGCSLKWKGQIIDRHAKKLFADHIKAGGKVLRAIGYDAGPCDSKRGGVESKGPWRWIYPLREWGWDRDRCMQEIESVGLEVPCKSSCWFCLGGETEVVTRNGVRPIRDLAGRRHQLLVPTKYKLGGLTHRGGFQEVEVRSFGTQPLFEVRLRRLAATRMIRATAEHRWFLKSGSQWSHITESVRTTDQLNPGDKLRTLRAMPPIKERLMAPAIAQGFTFGDGTRGQGERPASVILYGKKDLVVLPYFRGCVARSTKHNGKRTRTIYGLPRFWKELPPIRESRAFLLSWLAGYFAADGSVSKNGQPILHSANPEALKFVRDAAAVCGVGYSKIGKTLRLGTGKRLTPLYKICLRRVDLPLWFFLNKQHLARVKAAGTRDDLLWKVERVKKLSVREEVFCAIVPGATAFGLSEDLMTGNCSSMKPAELVQLAKRHPDLARRAVVLEDNARPRLRVIQGLWGNGVKGTRGGEKKPGSWRVFLAEHAPEVLPELPKENGT